MNTPALKTRSTGPKSIATGLLLSNIQLVAAVPAAMPKAFIRPTASVRRDLFRENTPAT